MRHELKKTFLMISIKEFKISIILEIFYESSFIDFLMRGIL